MTIHRIGPHTLATAAAPVDVLLTHGFFMALDPKQASKARPYPPLSTLQLAALLRGQQLSVAVFDAMLAADESAFAAALAAARPRLVILQEDNFNFLSKMCLGRMREAALNLVRMGRAAGLPVLVNGSDASDHPEVYLAAGATGVARGEGDWTLLEAARSILDAATGTSPWPIEQGSDEPLLPAGLSVMVADRRVDGLPRPVERDLDRFPEPSRDLVDLAAYRAVWHTAHGHGHFSLNLASSRGCPYHCNWCAKPIWGQRYGLRSPERVVAEIAGLLAADPPPDRLWFADDIFGLHPAWTVAFGDAMAAAGVRVPFQIQSRADLITPEAAAALAAAGCEEVWLGAESGDQAILDAMEKGIRLEQLPAALGQLRGFGIRVGLFLQFGYPGEDWDALLRTVELVRRLKPDAIGISVSYPLPGTRFYQRVREAMSDREHWADSQDLAMLYQGPFPTEIYRRLHRLLHAEHDALLAVDAASTAGALAAATTALMAARAEWPSLERDARAAGEQRLRVALPILDPAAVAAPGEGQGHA